MQNYMISARKKNGVFPSETVEDRAAKDFRNMVRTRNGRQRQKKAGSLMYAVSACLVLVLIVMGVSMVNNFDKMRSVQTTLDNLSAGAPETVETSGTVTAVTPEEEDGTGDTSDASVEEGSGEEEQSTDAQAEEQTDQRESGTAESESGDTSAQDEASVQDELSVESSSDAVSDTDAETSDSSSQSSGENGSDGVYVVEKGDTLAIISRKMYGDISHVDAICRMNGIEDGDLIYVGQKLLLP